MILTRSLGTPCSSAIVLLAVGFLAFGNDAFPYDGECSEKADVDQLPPGTWCEVPNSGLIDSQKKPHEWADAGKDGSPSYDSYQRVMGVKGITAWSSAAFDKRRQRLLVFGGGHNDYGGNEIYAFTLEKLRWTRLTDPTPFPNRSPDDQNDDGTPISRHTYGGIVYLEDRDSLLALGGAPDSAAGGCGVAGVWFFDLAARERTGRYNPSQWTRWDSAGIATGCNDEALFDSARGRILYNSFRGWYELDLTDGAMSHINKSVWIQKTSSIIVEDATGLEFIVQFGGGVFEGYIRRDLTSPTLEGISVETSGDVSMESAVKPGTIFNKETGTVVAWAGGGDMFVLNLADNVWKRVVPNSRNLVDPGSQDAAGGTFGRFQFSEELDVFVLMDLATENVFLYRMDWSKFAVEGH